jgi:hypothetical protein
MQPPRTEQSDKAEKAEKAEKAKAPGTTLVIKEKGASQDGKAAITLLNYRGFTKDKKSIFFAANDGKTVAFANAYLHVGPMKDGKLAEKHTVLYANLRTDGGLFFGKKDSPLTAEVKGAKAQEINAFLRADTERQRAVWAAKVADIAPEAAALKAAKVKP